VTLTFAQSLDAKIAGKNGRQLILSGKESMVMTHWMRTMHDAILVGIGTALNDDPQLNTRHLPPRPADGTPYHLPRPVILDTHLRLSPECKLLNNFRQGKGRRPWIICRSSSPGDSTEWESRFKVLENAGARIIQVPPVAGVLPIPTVLETLHKLGVRSLMVEGGARIIESFFAEPASFSSVNIDTIIVTVAPRFVGDDGIGYNVKLGDAADFKFVDSRVFGRDSVVVLKAVSSARSISH